MAEEVGKGGIDTHGSDFHGQATALSWKALFTFSSRAHAFLLTTAIGLAVLSGIVTPALALLLGRIFDDFSSYGGGKTDSAQLVDSVNRNVFYLLALGGVTWICNWLFFSAWMYFGDLQATGARIGLYDAMMNKDVAWYETRPSGSSAVIQRLQTNIRELQIATAQPLGFLIQHTTTVLTSLGLAFYSSWDLTLVSLASVPIGVAVLATISGRMQLAIEKQAEQLTAATNRAKSALDAIELVKCFNAQDFEAWKYADIVRQAGKHYLKLARANSMQIGFVRLLVRTLFVSGFWYGSHLVSQGSKTSGQILTAFWSCLMATQTFEQILPQMIVLEKGRTAGAALQSFLAVERGSWENEGGTKLQPATCDGDISLKGITFAYPSQPDRDCLRNVDLFFPAGETTFVVGRSGSGKSTFAALLVRLYNARGGDIFIDNIRIETLDLHWLRRNITIVQQDSTLFDETVLRNIAFGRGNEVSVKRSSLNTAIEMASLSSTIEDLPGGLNTFIGNGGTSLSGGQTQRVALARARVRDTPILILDEVTSALDRATAACVVEAILSWRTGKCTIVITHDLTQVRADGFTYVLDEGKVVQEGYRHALELAKPSPFVKLLLSSGNDLRSPTMPGHSRNPSANFFRTRRTNVTHIQAFTSMDLPTGSKTGKSIALKPLPLVPPEARTKRVPGVSRRRDSLVSALSGATINVNSIANARQSMFSGPRSRGHSANRERSDNSTLVPKPSMASLSQHDKAAEGQEYRGHWTELKQDADVELAAWPVESSPSRPLQPSEEKEQGQPLALHKVLATVWPRLGTKQRLLLVLGFIAGTVHAACTPFFSYVFAKLLATYYSPGDKSQAAMRLSLVLLGLTFTDATAAFFLHYLFEICGEAWINDIRVEAMGKILGQPRDWYDSAEANTAQVVEYLDRGAEEMRLLLGKWVGLLYVAIAMSVIGLIWCIVESWQLTLVGLASAPLVYALTSGFDRASATWEGKSNGAGELATSIFSETFEKIKTVRSLTLEPHFRTKYGRAARFAQKIGNRRAVITGAFFGISDASVTFIIALIFWYGSRLVSDGTYEATRITTVFSMLLFVISNVNAIVTFMPQLSSSRVGAASLLRLCRLSGLDNHENLGDTRLDSLSDTIRFRNVRFSYPTRPGVLALDGLSLDVPLGKSTALVGLSGSGKSTIVSLLLRLYSLGGSRSSGLPSSGASTGSLKVGSIPISQLDIRSWRSLVAYVPQQSKLFPGTVAENIAYGLDPDSHRTIADKVSYAASQTGIDTFINTLPDGYQTQIGEGGIGLSGGQKQKLAIARALVHSPSLLVLDEPTSALDATSASEIRALIKRMVIVANATVLVVTHSVEMMRSADRVCVLEGGRVSDTGTFDELKQSSKALRRVVGAALSC